MIEFERAVEKRNRMKGLQKMKDNANLPGTLTDNEIEERFGPIDYLDEHFYMSAKTVCKRLDISYTKFKTLIRDNPGKVDIYDFGESQKKSGAVRYRLMDLIRLLRKRQ